MNSMNRVLRSFTLATALVCLAGLSVAQNTGGGIFKYADGLMQTAVEGDAALLSPGNFATATRHYDKAKDYSAKGRDDKAQGELKKSEDALQEAIDASKLGKVNFAATLKTRSLALAAEAPQYEAEMWQKAAQQFETAARALESGNVKSATSKSDKARTYFEDAELAAIKTAIVGKARELIAANDADKVSRQAPVSLDKAKSLVAQAEASLDRDRYQTSGPIALAAEAEYEARHAAYLATQVRRVEKKDISTEQLILEWEKPLQRVATALDVTTDLSDGFAKAATASVSMAEALSEDNAEMTARVAKLEAELGGNERIVEETKRLQQQLSQVESLFGPGEARVVRQGNDLVLRMVGLSFPSGQSVIETRYFGILKKVQNAIEVYPDAPVIIEGHTDSVGSDAVNMKLSQDRANSVREYLIANLGLPESRVASVGYGKTRPIASNETDTGRAQNRRIDIVIKDARARKAN